MRKALVLSLASLVLGACGSDKPVLEIKPFEQDDVALQVSMSFPLRVRVTAKVEAKTFIDIDNPVKEFIRFDPETLTLLSAEDTATVTVTGLKTTQCATARRFCTVTFKVRDTASTRAWGVRVD